MCKSVNTGIVAAFASGGISSASIMVPCPAAIEAIKLSVAHPEWDVGVHVTLTSEWPGLRWGPVSPYAAVPSLVDEDGYFWKDVALFTAHAALDDVSREIDAQLKRAYDLGLRPTHMDCHMYSLFRSGVLFRAYLEAAERWHLPALGKRAPGAPERIFSLTEFSQTRNFTRLYVQMVSSDWQGVAQLTSHPGHNTPELRSIAQGIGPWGAEWRQADLEAISSVDLRLAITKAGIERVGWRIGTLPHTAGERIPTPH